MGILFLAIKKNLCLYFFNKFVKSKIIKSSEPPKAHQRLTMIKIYIFFYSQQCLLTNRTIKIVKIFERIYHHQNIEPHYRLPENEIRNHKQTCL